MVITMSCPRPVASIPNSVWQLAAIPARQRTRLECLLRQPVVRGKALSLMTDHPVGEAGDDELRRRDLSREVCVSAEA
jgi:hypothetical protein